MFLTILANLIVIGDNDRRHVSGCAGTFCAPREDTRWWRTEKFTIHCRFRLWVLMSDAGYENVNTSWKNDPRAYEMGNQTRI